jgi:hypothetical protein
MRIILCIFIAILTAFISGCSSIGYSDGAIVSRSWFNERLGAEISLKPSSTNSSSQNESSNTSGSSVTEYSNANYYAYLGAGLLVNAWEAGGFKLSVMAKYFDYTSMLYSKNESFYFDSLGQLISRNYSDQINYNSFNNHHISLIFPDIEYSVPGLKGVKLLFSMELLGISIQNNGGNAQDNYSANQSLDSYGSNYTYNAYLPGKITNVRIYVPLTGTTIYSALSTVPGPVKKGPGAPVTPDSSANPQPQPDNNLNFIKFGVLYEFN